MVRLFGSSDDDTPTETLKELFVRNLVRDVDSQLKSERIEPNYELLDALTNAAVNGGVDDKQYVV